MPEDRTPETQEVERAAAPGERALAETPDETITRLQDEVAALADELDRQRGEARRYYQEYLRAVADLDNYRKVALRDRGEVVARARRDLLGVILQVADTLERAVAAGGGATSDPVVEGIRLAHRTVLEFLAQQGVRPMETIGRAFDPQYHEAVGVGRAPGGAEGAFPPGTITAEVQRGYLAGDEVLRPARVLVVKEDEPRA